MLKNELEVKTVKGNENNIATLALRKFLEAETNANFTEENIKTIDGQLQLWGKQIENWEGQRENVRKQIEAQIEQWSQENILTGKKLDLEEKKSHSGNNPKGYRDYTGNWSSSRNSNG